jgi:hypothetical protein
VDRLRSSEAKLDEQVKAHKVKVEDLKKKVAEATKKFEVAMVKHEISEIEKSRAQKNVEELRASKERCYEISLECAKNLKNSIAKVDAYSSKQKFICGDPDGVIQWNNGEAEAFDEILSDRGYFCAFASAPGLYQFLRRSDVTMPRLLLSQNLLSQPVTSRILQPKLLRWAENFTPRCE